MEPEITQGARAIAYLREKAGKKRGYAEQARAGQQWSEDREAAVDRYYAEAQALEDAADELAEMLGVSQS